MFARRPSRASFTFLSWDRRQWRPQRASTGTGRLSERQTTNNFLVTHIARYSSPHVGTPTHSSRCIASRSLCLCLRFPAKPALRFTYLLLVTNHCTIAPRRWLLIFSRVNYGPSYFQQVVGTKNRKSARYSLHVSFVKLHF